MAIDLRLRHFMPGILIPPQAHLHLAVGILFLIIALCTLPITSHPRTFAATRVWLGLQAAWIFYNCMSYPYDVPTRGVDTAIASIAIYGIMRVIDACFVDLLVGVHSPPRWVVDGKALPLPTTLSERVAYALDYLFSLQGTSVFKNTTWDWMTPSTKRRLPSNIPRLAFIRSAFWSLFKQYLVYDALDALNKSRIWDTRLLHPITNGGLSLLEQMLFAFSVCVTTSLSISISATLVSIIGVAYGVPTEAWPSLFDAPFTAVSLTDFWAHRWHSLFRRMFDRMSLIVLHLPAKFGVPLSPQLRKHLRATSVFGLSTLLHMILMHRLPISESHYHPTFFDPSIIMFFLSQPVALLVERTVVIPLAGGNVWITRCWAWAWMLYSGRWWADVWIRRGLWDQREKVVGYSLVRGLWNGTWIP